jgi:peptidyl-prolyl cis-trans isomerase-like protein 2
MVNKLAKRAENDKKSVTEQQKPKDDINWFGTKVGSSTENGGANGGGGVGKYLTLKRRQDAIGISEGDEDKKKRKIGFGNFDGW